MVSKLIAKGKKLFTNPQSSVLSAATIIMVMIILSRVLGLVRHRVLANFFSPGDLSLFFAAFRLPDLVFEVLVFGTFSSAFIPVFTKSLKKGNHKAWNIATSVVNIGIILFGVFALFVSFSADSLYRIFAPGFTNTDREIIVEITRVLFLAQGFFVVSYVLTGVLESLRRFLIPALAPLFYNLGIILGTIILFPRFSLMAPAIGVLMGAALHFLIQLPLATRLGFRFRPMIKIDSDVKKIGKLASPRIVEISFLQLQKMAELFFASLISTASYTYYTFANSLQLLPVGIFGTSIAKAALPTLSSESDNPKKFTKIFLDAFYQVIFFCLPIATILIILRIPIVRLAFGTDIFGWESTVTTGMVLTYFSFGIVFQAVAALLNRSFYATNDTKTPVAISIITIFIVICADFILTRILNLPVWGLAAGFSIGSIFQASTLFFYLNKKILKKKLSKIFYPILKSVIASLSAGFLMYFLLKIFDKSVWVKRLSFLGKIESARYFPFEKFVLDTRYTVNLLILTFIVSMVGLSVYLGVSVLLKNREVFTLLSLVKRVFVKHKISPIPRKEQEMIAPTASETSS